MAEYSINVPVVAEVLALDLPVTMEKIDLHVSVTPEKMELEDGNLRGSSSGERGGNGRAKVLPRYLSSPTGSCHDLCKYGIKPVFCKEANSIRITPGKGEHLTQTETVPEHKKKSATHTPRKGMNSLKHDDDLKMRAVKTNLSVLPMGSKRNSGADIAGEIGILSASSLGTPTSRSNNRIGSPLCTPRSRINSGIGSPNSGGNTGIGSPLGGPSSGRNTGIGSWKDKSTSVMDMKKVSASTSVKRVASIKIRPDSNGKGVSPLKSQNNARKAEFKHLSNENAPEKILHVIEAKPAKRTVSTPSSEGKSSTPVKSRTHINYLASFPEKKNTKQAQTGVHTSTPILNKSLQDAQNGIDSQKSPLSSVASIPPPMSPNESLQSEDSGFISKHSAKQKERPNRVGEISTVDEDDSACKLNSRKEPDQSEADTGRKIFEGKDFHIGFADSKTEFAKVVLKHQDKEGNGNSQASLIEKVLLKHLDGEKKDNQNLLNAVLEVVLRHPDAEDEKVPQNFHNNAIEVALRHQDVEYKKENQSLLNSVIEETASKLVEAQQSKVKALVGAFESLISLQDLTPLATARAH